MSQDSVYHSLFTAFQSEVIRHALAATGGNRTHAARLLGLQRTYLLRLMRDRGIDVPRPPRKRRAGGLAPAATATLPEFRIEITGWEPMKPAEGDNRSAVAATEQRRPARALGQAARHAG